MNITIPNAIISYPNLFTAKQVNNQGAPKYSAAFIIRADNPKLKELVAAASDLTAKAYPDGVPHNFKTLPLCKGEVYQDGKHKNDPIYQGAYVLNTSKDAAQGKPSVVDGNMQPVLDPGKVYPGLVVNVAVSVYTYKNVSKGVTTGLEAVQIVRDGERLDNKPSVNELFKPIDVIETGGGNVDPLG